MGRLSLASWLYLTVVVGVAAYILSYAPIGVASTQWIACYAVLALLFLICDSTPTTLAARQSAWSPSSAATLAAIVLLNGGIGAAMVGAIAVLTLRRHVPLAELHPIDARRQCPANFREQAANRIGGAERFPVGDVADNRFHGWLLRCG